MSGKQDLARSIALAQKQFLAGDFEQSTELFRKLATTHPDCFEAHKGLGFALISLDKHAEALTELQKAESIHQEDATLPFGIGQCHEALGDHKHALESYQEAYKRDAELEIAIKAEHDLLLKLAAQAKAKKKIVWEKGYLDQANDLPGDSADVWLALVDYHSRLQEFEEAKIWVKKLIEVFPHVPQLPKLKERFGFTKKAERGFLY